MFGQEQMNSSPRRGSLYESKVWGTGHSPPQKHYSIDLSMLTPNDSLLLSVPSLGPLAPQGAATGVAGQDYIHSHVQGIQQLRSGFEAAQTNRGSSKMPLSHVDEIQLQREVPAAISDFSKGAAFFPATQLNTASNFGGFRSRAFSDTPSLASSNMQLLPQDLSSPLTVTTPSGLQTSPIIPNSSFKLSPTQQSPSLNTPFGSNVNGSYNLGVVEEDQDNHFTYEPMNPGATQASPSGNAPIFNAGQPSAFRRGSVQSSYNDDQLRYWNGFSKNAWSPSTNSENFQNRPDVIDPTSALRRYSYGDVYHPALAGPMKQFQPPKQFNSTVPGHRFSVGSVDQKNSQFAGDRIPIAVEEYFSVDIHQRVKVNVDFFKQRYLEDQKYLDEQYQLPQFPCDSSVRNLQLVLVCFKAGRLDVFYMPETKPNLRSIKVGDLVIVEADRGRDLGKVIEMNISVDETRLLKLLQFLEQLVALHEKSTEDITLASLHHGTGSGTKASGEGVYFAPPTLYCPKPIIALALRAEILLVFNKSHDEEKACRLSLAKIASTLNLLNAGETKGTLTLADLSQMRLIDAEYQFDRRKLIFYYSTSKRIDFRDLVRELFRIYKTRIWMCAVNGIPYQPAVKKAPQRANIKLVLEAPMQMQKNVDRRMSGQLLNPQSEGADPLLFNVESMSQTDSDEVPRNFRSYRSAIAEDSSSQRGSGESLVLKSLVDTLNN